LVKKAGDGPVIFLQSSIHGDELAGAQVIFELFKQLSTMDIRGTVVAVQGMNPTGLLLHSRYFYQTGKGGSWVDLNRAMPGDITSTDSGARLSYTLWNDLYMPSNPTFFFDLHTQSTGTAFPYFVYADRRNELVDDIMKITPADIIKDDLGEDGTVETEMIKAGVPAVTLELGSPKSWNEEINMRGVQGIKNAMIHLGMWDGEIDMMNIETFNCNETAQVIAQRGGYMETIVELEDDVKEGTVLGYLFDAFGDVRENYTAPVAGRVLSLATDPIREPGSMIARLCYTAFPVVEEAAAVTTTKALRGPERV
jgi:uncharacterized protein